MVQDNFTLLLCLIFLVISCIVYQYFEITKTKNNALIKLDAIENQIATEQMLLKQKNKEVVKVKELEKETNQKLVTLKTNIVLIDFTFSEIFSFI